ncbi:putative bHLH transcription factor [Aspergillus mulundensis]|uniref:Putative bHLH transcription factor n=1 Tax=Aspergillus mulundensis TaxID=1810919 RepID=A0A3D8R9F0_9EURO|nr:putative bHLH transcription factor [Aspergillus mulundensis]RDW70679.1 putative bHLH transcription factor [Aspergillus mulundensis]
MSQATTTTFPTPLPNSDENDYSLQHLPRGHQQPISKTCISTFPGGIDGWTPSSQGIPVYPFVSTTSPGEIESPCEFINYEGFYANPLLQNIQNDDFLAIPYRPYFGSPIEDSESTTTTMPDLKFDPHSIQMGQPRPPLPYPYGPLSLEKPSLEGPNPNIFAPRAPIGPRRSSAPSLNIREMERERSQKLKHQNRRASHNVVEKRYRENLNRKFHMLECIVNKGAEPYACSPCSSPRSSPSSIASKKGNTTFSTSASARRQYTSPKASIIDSALRYIEDLRKENFALKGRLVLFETSSNPCLRGHPQGQVGVQRYDHDQDCDSEDEEVNCVKSEDQQ